MMTHPHPARAYQQSATLGASPVELVVLLYDAALGSLHRAAKAIDSRDIEKRTVALNHVLEVTAELQAALNFERGGEVARQLDGFYTVVGKQVLEASVKNSRPAVEALIAQFASLRHAWAEVERSAPGAM